MPPRAVRPSIAHMVPVLWVFAFALVAYPSWATASESCNGQVGHEQCPVAFLQTEARLHGRNLGAASTAARSVGSLRPLGRSFFSTNPEATADFWVRYFQAVRLPLPECSLGRRAAVRISVAEGGEPQTLVFVNDQGTGAEDLSQQIQDASGLILSKFGRSETASFVPWIDNHDAFHDNIVLNVSAMLEDELPMELYRDPFEGALVMRLYVPGTLWTVGAGASSIIAPEEMQQLEARWLQPSPEMCRESGARLPDPRPGWTKATHMSARPDIAARFLVDVLGGELLEPAFPWPPKDNCTAVQWVMLPDSMLQVHFVLSKEWELDGFSIQEEARKMNGLPALESGSFHAAMHNSMVFTADSLDAYVLRLQAKSLPYELLRTEESYVLIMEIPENAITLQIRSQHVSTDLTGTGRSNCLLDWGSIALS